MKFPRWILPALMHVLSLSRLTSATGDNKASAPTSHTPQGTEGGGGPSFLLGFALSAPPVQPDQPSNTLSLDLNFVLQVANHELKIPIMPLHLLGKKSWNVYNTANIETVRRDEAHARSLEEASEQRMQELDSARRMQILRGEEPTPLPIEDAPPSPSSKHARTRDHGDGSGRERKKRKRAGENDTDFEMRLAAAQTQNQERQLVLRREGDAPLVDHTGHIDLFPQPKPSSSSIEKNEEAERELAKRKKEYEDQYTMKFSNAAGFKNSIGEDPWYKRTNSTTTDHIDDVVVSKDVWGNEDPRRKEREAQRIVSNDPLAMMRAGARQVRQVKDERMKWREEKDREMRALDEQERERRREKKRKRRREYGSADEIEFLDLDGPERSSKRHRDDDRHLERRHKRPKDDSEDIREDFSLDGPKRSSSRRHKDDGERSHERGGEERGTERRHRRDEGRRHEDRDQDRRHKSRRHSYD